MTVKTYFYIACLVVLVIFVVQNFALVNVSFLLWEITLPRSFMLLLVFGLGLACGYGLAELREHRRGKSSS